MRVIIGYGNELRGEDAFGVDAIKQLQKLELKNTKLISLFQLVPEIVLELLDAKEIIFIDVTYSKDNHYALACSIVKNKNANITHHISPEMIFCTLKNLYNKKVEFKIYSMLSNNFEDISDVDLYEKALKKTIDFLASTTKQ